MLRQAGRIAVLDDAVREKQIAEAAVFEERRLVGRTHPDAARAGSKTFQQPGVKVQAGTRTTGKLEEGKCASVAAAHRERPSEFLVRKQAPKVSSTIAIGLRDFTAERRRILIRR